MASTWDVDLIHKVGEAIAEECIALKLDVILGLGVNMKRTPLCGRNFEYYSEDPYLAGEMAASFIQGVQSKGAGTSLKHFAANNQETQRSMISSDLELPSVLNRESTLREWIADPRGMSVLSSLHQQVNEQLPAKFGGNGDE
jgi:beta-glucosidase-like glycosyl hydrolase